MNIQFFVCLGIFLVVNFAALAIGGLATADAVSGEWYQEINKAPWTPPGWVFGAAWTSIMALYSVFMAFAWQRSENKKKLLTLYGVQWILNVSWNPVFFLMQLAFFGLLIILALTALIGYFIYTYKSLLKLKTLLIAPYFIWLLIASSLNLYIVMFN